MADSTSRTIEHFTLALAPHYRLGRLLGAGGAATVHLATDERHHRQVAIKILRRDLLATEGAERFVQEIRVAARLTHPHIVPVLNSGHAAGSPYFVMPYIEGESLRGRLTRDKTIPLAEAIGFVLEAADALEYSHAAGILHRDIKPENILLHRGHAVIADFGIARALSQSAPDQRTSAGLVLGTPAYMSPEQAAGERELDGRSDVYSLALVLFEMISGVLPFTARTTSALIARRFMGPAPRLSSLVPEVPEDVDDAIATALSLEAADRPATPLAFARMLAGGGDEGAAPLRTGVHLTHHLTRTTSAISTPSLPSVAVLPFANLSTDPENEFLSDGITEEIMTTLSRLRTLRVAARSSSFAFKGKRGDVRAIAEQLGVQNILDGSVRRSGTQVRVSAELIDASTGFPVWSDRLDRPLDDVFAIQDDIARAIADALASTLLHDTGAAISGGVDGGAYEAYLRGRFELNRRTEAGLHAAARFFEQAIALQPEFALAHHGLADALLLLGVYGVAAPTTVLPQARAAAERALASDPALGEAYATLGTLRALHDWDWSGAEDAFRRATALNPRHPAAWQWRAMNHLIPMGRRDEARAAIERARALDPLSMVMAASTGVVFHLAGDLPGAIRVLRHAVETDPNFGMTHYFLGIALRDAGELAAAGEALRTAIARTGGTPEMSAALAVTLAAQGDAEGAKALRRDLVERAATRYVSPCLLAQVHVALGELDEADAAVERALEVRDTDLVFLGVRPAYAALRGRPRFDAARTRIGV